MPRDANGNYTQPLPDVQPGEVIQSVWANTTIDDIALAMTDSLDRNGRGGMLAPFTFADGTQAAPGAAWANEPSTGLYRAGAADLRITVTNQDRLRVTDTLAQIWDGVGAQWVDILGAGLSDATQITYDPTGDLILTGTTVDEVLGEIDTALNDSTVHIADTTIHYADVAVDGIAYVRLDQAWVDASGLYLTVTGTAADSDKVDGYDVEVVTVLPGTPDPNTIYFVAP